VSDGRDTEPRFRVTDKRRSARTEGSGTPESSASADVEPGDAGPTEAADTPSAADEVEEYREHLQRLQAEFDNYRKRTLKEQSRMLELASEPLVRRMLEVLDDFELALLHAEQQPEIETFLKGVELVFAKLVDVLRAEGLERIEAEGKPFDPELHEALMQTGEGDGEPVVAEVFRPGYTLKGHVLRPAGVRVERR
jgi:molecular chaperone GrpE